jgi:hypothetical protein
MTGYHGHVDRPKHGGEVEPACSTFGSTSGTSRRISSASTELANPGNYGLNGGLRHDGVGCVSGVAVTAEHDSNKSPLAVLLVPSLTLANLPLAVLPGLMPLAPPPLTLANSPLAVLSAPPLTLAASALIVFASPATRPPKAALVKLLNLPITKMLIGPYSALIARRMKPTFDAYYFVAL